MSNEVPTICPDCGGKCYDYNGTQVCEDCYHRAIDEINRKVSMHEVTSGVDKFLDSAEFYNLCQVYRHTPITHQKDIVHAFEHLKEAIIDKVATLEEWAYHDWN